MRTHRAHGFGQMRFRHFNHATEQTMLSLTVLQKTIQQTIRFGIRGSIVAAVFTIGASAIGNSAHAQSFQFAPSEKVLSGTPITIRLTGLPANSDVVVMAERPVSEWGMADNQFKRYRASATFKSDAKGEIDLATATPQKGGSYRKADVRGMFWSMMPMKDAVPAEWKAGEVRFTARVADKDVASGMLTLMRQLPDVKTEPVAQFPKALFASLPTKAGEKRPAVILLGGSEGGSMITRFAAELASHGFAVIAVPYYSPPQWPSQKQEIESLPAAFADIPIERLNQVRDWLKTRADVDASRIAIHGTSKGAEFAALAATYLEWPTAIVAVVPTDVVWEGWGPNVEPGKRASFSFNGKPFAFTPYLEFGEEFMGFQTGEAVRIRRPQDKGRAANPAAAAKARIPIERYKGAVALVAGQEDQVWNSGMMAHNIAERRAEAAANAPKGSQIGETLSLVYVDAGHAIGGNGFQPTTQYDAGPSKMGGTPEGNAFAQWDQWTKVIDFLKRNLGVK
jgi:dienelactone hydrolase